MSLSTHVTNNKGALHLISLVIQQIESIFIHNGYTQFNSPEIDTEWFNFTALNISESHPTRTEHQTFYTNNNKLLRTQTSNFQPRVLAENLNKFKVFTVGRTYRNDNDATHTPMFHQVDILICNEKSSIAELMNIIRWFLSQFFYDGKQSVDIRLRPSYFPFTTPSYEVDMFYQGRWLELLGCGITHKKVFEHLNQSFRYVMALGCGVERLAMIKYGLTDIRTLYDKQPYSVHAQYELYRNKGEEQCV